MTSLLGFGAISQSNSDKKTIAERNIRELHYENNSWVSKFDQNGCLKELIHNKSVEKITLYFDSAGHLVAASNYQPVNGSFLLNDTVSIIYDGNQIASIDWYKSFNHQTGFFKYHSQQMYNENNDSLIRSNKEVWYRFKGSELEKDTIYESFVLVDLSSNQFQLTRLEKRNSDTLKIENYRYNTDSTDRIVQIFELNSYGNNEVEKDCTECKEVKRNKYECLCEPADGKQSGRYIRLYFPEALNIDSFLPKSNLSKKGIYYHRAPLRAYTLSRRRLGRDSVQIVYY
ncbi:MAG: hypothetical protein ACFHU9_03700 [Fluviicola sp.]